MYSIGALPPGNDLHESNGRAQGLIGLQCVFICCMSRETQITKVWVSEMTMGTLPLILGGFSGQPLLPSFGGNCFCNLFVGALDRGHVSFGFSFPFSIP